VIMVESIKRMANVIVSMALKNALNTSALIHRIKRTEAGAQLMKETSMAKSLKTRARVENR
jgi:hypothetical protein